MAKVWISPTGGQVESIYRDEVELRDLGAEVSIRRASTIEPTSDGMWEVILLGGKLEGEILGRYTYREEAVRAEVEELEKRGLR